VGLRASTALVALIFAAACAPPPPGAKPAGAPAVRALPEQATDLFIYAYPLLNNRRFRWIWHHADSPDFRSSYGRWGHVPDLASPEMRITASPSVDTLYTLNFLDADTHPFVIGVPPVDDRYFSVQLTDAYIRTLGYVGLRSGDTGGSRVLVAGPTWNGVVPAGIDHVFRSETPWVIVVLRIEVLGADDEARARRIRAGFTLGGLDSEPLPTNVTIAPPADLDDPRAVWSALHEELVANPPPAADARTARTMERLGLGPGRSGDLDSLDAEGRRALEVGARDGMARVVAAALDTTEPPVRGWGYARAGMGSFDDQPLFRAGLAHAGLLGNLPEEVTHLFAYDDAHGQPLTGASSYRIRFEPRALPPVGAFWSITMYAADDSSLVANPISRYAISSRMQRLRRGEDGSLELLLSNEAPPEGGDNWLPTPAGDFYMIFRTYLPSREIVERSWMPPWIERIDG
jgi:hypothetical protein